MASLEISLTDIPIGVEDKFLIFAFGEGRYHCPTEENANHLSYMIKCLPGQRYQTIFDLRGVRSYDPDIHNFIENVTWEWEQPCVLLGKREIEVGWARNLRDKGFKIIRTKGAAHATTILPFRLFDSDLAYYLDAGPEILGFDSLDNLRQLGGTAADIQFLALEDYLNSIHRHSLLVEFTMAIGRDEINIVPYHSHSIHEIETKRDTVLLSRPGVIAQATGAVFSHEIESFERLINNPSTKERDIQRFLESHPQFLQGLNYANIYPQIILERDQGSLRPDFILEPFEGAFCDILEIKIPPQKLFVGRKDRATLASGLHEVAAQLREYATYFEQDKYRKLVHQKYGLRVYKPRLIAIVGRDMKQMSQPEFRRALTQYDNLQFLTFDELLRHAKRHMLI